MTDEALKTVKTVGTSQAAVRGASAEGRIPLTREPVARAIWRNARPRSGLESIFCATGMSA